MDKRYYEERIWMIYHGKTEGQETELFSSRISVLPSVEMRVITSEKCLHCYLVVHSLAHASSVR